jgi:hypothetical protein
MAKLTGRVLYRLLAVEPKIEIHHIQKHTIAQCRIVTDILNTCKNAKAFRYLGIKQIFN